MSSPHSPTPSSDVLSKDRSPVEIVAKVSFGGGAPSDPFRDYLELTAVLRDAKEEELIRKIWALSRQHPDNFYRAQKTDSPYAMQFQLNTVVARLKLQFDYLEELSLHRHGEEQIHEVQYVINGEEQKKQASQTDLATSDACIEGLFLHAVENLESFSGDCVKKRGHLACYALGPDRYKWPGEFQQLETYILRQCTKFRYQVRKLRNRKKQTHKVVYFGNVPASKVLRWRKATLQMMSRRAAAFSMKSQNLLSAPKSKKPVNTTSDTMLS